MKLTPKETEQFYEIVEHAKSGDFRIVRKIIELMLNNRETEALKHVQNRLLPETIDLRNYSQKKQKFILEILLDGKVNYVQDEVDSRIWEIKDKVFKQIEKREV